jgi:hypothetical protein
VRVKLIHRTTVSGDFHANSLLGAQTELKRQAVDRVASRSAGFTLIELT